MNKDVYNQMNSDEWFDADHRSLYQKIVDASEVIERVRLQQSDHVVITTKMIETWANIRGISYDEAITSINSALNPGLYHKSSRNGKLQKKNETPIK